MIFTNSNKNRLLIVKYFIVPILTVFLSGCMGMGSKFDCNVDSGGRCIPMHHVNQMANYGAFTEKPYKADKLILTEKKENKNIQNTYGTVPIRSSEKIQQIWIGPYEDANGNYHEGSYVYAVVKKGSWTSP